MMGISAAVAVGREVPLLVDLVGVFVDPVPGQVETVLDQVPLTILQFHGDETRAACEQFGLPYIKAIRMKPEIDPLTALETHPKAAALLLILSVKKPMGVLVWPLTGTKPVLSRLCPLLLPGV